MNATINEYFFVFIGDSLLSMQREILTNRKCRIERGGTVLLTLMMSVKEC